MDCALISGGGFGAVVSPADWCSSDGTEGWVTNENRYRELDDMIAFKFQNDRLRFHIFEFGKMSLTNLGRWRFLRIMMVDYDYYGLFLSVLSTCQIKVAVVIRNSNRGSNAWWNLRKPSTITTATFAHSHIGKGGLVVGGLLRLTQPWNDFSMNISPNFPIKVIRRFDFCCTQRVPLFCRFQLMDLYDWMPKTDNGCARIQNDHPGKFVFRIWSLRM